MINESQARKYCREDITLIKNYAEAVADKTRMWLCHHINGEPFTGFCRKDLKKMNMYLNRPASELMFVTRKMHEDIHGSFKKAGKRDKSGSKNSFYGKHHSEETRHKLSAAHKGRMPWNKGRTLSEITKKKISESLKSNTPSEETRQKLSESNTGKHWYNNGFVNAFAKSCPEGFVEGRIRKEIKD